MRRVVAAVAAAGLLAGCSSSTEPFLSRPRATGNAIVARVIADDAAFPIGAAGRPRFVPCQGLSGCARTAPGIGEFYPGAQLPAGVDAEVDPSIEFAMYLVGATFEQADLASDTVHVQVRERGAGLQMVKLDGRDVQGVADLRFSFEQDGRVICTSSWEGCG